MIKKIILATIILVSCCFNGFSQTITIQNINHVPLEGEIVQYKIIYSNIPTPHKLRSSVVRGTVISENLEPNQQNEGSIQVQWACNEVNGSVTITENITGTSGTLNTDIITFVHDPNSIYCNTASPVKQNLFYGQMPALLTVINCSNSCINTPQYQYQWQVGDVPIGVFPQVPASYTDIMSTPNTDQPAIFPTYQPPAYYTDCIKAYRRRTTVTYQNVQYVFYSSPAVISTFDYLNGGSISWNSTYNNGVPVINQTPATGGLCDGYNYVYTWELSVNGSPFTSIGTGANYPTGVQIPGSCSIRRRVDCGGQTQYSNVLNITVQTLLGGTITGTGTYTFNAIPPVTQTAASGGACSNPDYVYAWERSINNGPWVTFSTGTGPGYPAVNGGVIATCKVRRKVHCVYEDAYSNEITFTMLPYTSPNIENLNYVRVNDIVIPGVQSWEQADALATGDKLQTTTYLDAFGRPIQQVTKQGGIKQSVTPLDPPNASDYQDLVSYFEYDELGRAKKEFLPYATQTNPGFFKTNAQAEQKDFNNTKYGEPAGSNFTFSNTTYDGSPLNRVINTKLPGYYWNTNSNYKGISGDYDFNSPATDNVINWEIDASSGNVAPGSPYGANKLIKNITKDERDKLIVKYVDFGGNVILKKVQKDDNAVINSYSGWLNTYYVYDDFGRLRYTITPKAVELMNSSGNWAINVNDDIRKGLCFYLEYDKKGRVTVKHSPDAGEVWLVYDNRDRLVLSQDENQRHRTPAKPSNQWSFSLYDEYNRVSTTGLINDNRDRNQMQGFVDGLTPSNQQVEIYTGAWETITAYNPVAGRIPGTGSTYYCGACTASYTNSVSYFDDYSHAPSTQNYISLTANDFAPNTNLYVEQSSLSFRVRGITTVSKLRILDDKYDNDIITDQKFLTSTTYFDEKGRVIQTHAENIKAGIDISSMQYDFAGKILSTRGKHNASVSLFSGLLIITKNDFDLLGRVTKLWKLYTKNASDIPLFPTKYKKLSELSLDEFGMAKTKKMGEDHDPVNSPPPGTPLEIQDISYNIQGWLTGVNKDYALTDGSVLNGMTDQWKRRFGFYLGYENGDNKFTASQWNGNITGLIWRSQGDNTARKYNYEYDNINRFKAANFAQRTKLTDVTWTNSIVDVSASVSSYDANGNIMGMKHTGIVPGTNGGVLLDDLQYQYMTNSNKLINVTDLANSALSGKQGDFKDYAPPAGNDYNYDLNGNLKYDKNKGIIDNAAVLTSNDPAAGIISNFLDLPQTITIKDKSKTEYTYDASGNKLAKKVTQLIPTPPPPKTTYYVGGFIYEDDNLQYILNEEGRLRIIEPVDAWSAPSGQVNYLKTTSSYNVEIKITPTSSKWGVWDNFLKDNLSNTRMVLTEEYHEQQMFCSMEKIVGGPPPPPDPRKDEEEATFGNAAPNNEVDNTRIAKPGGWSSNSSSFVSKLFSTGNAAIGPNAILKVMAGDYLDGTAKFYYQANGQAQGNSILTNIVTSLFGMLTGSGNTAQTIKDNINTSPGGVLSSGIGSFLTDHQPLTNNTNQPRAYLNYIFFDEQFRYVSECSGAVQVDPITGGAPSIDGNVTIPLNAVRATKNGYVYVYLSNETQNVSVYFDDLSIKHRRGAIVEDNAYYPFGLRIQGISARAALKPQTKYGYQGDYSEQDDETGYDEFELRNYDPQTGRFIQQDLYQQFTSPYTGMGNDPINTVDEDGGWSAGLTGMAIGMGIGFATPYIYEGVTGNHVENKGLWGLAGAFIGAGIGYGAGASLAGEGSFLNNTAAFYDGLLGTHIGELNGSGQVSFGSRIGCVSNMAEIPNLWGWLPRINLPSVNLSLFKWVDDVAFSAWKIIEVQKLVTEGAAPQNPDYQKMDRTVNNTPSGSDLMPDNTRIHDEKTITVPSGDKTKTKMIVEDEYAYRINGVQKIFEGIFTRTFTSKQTGNQYTVTIDHRAQSGAGQRYNRDGSVASRGKNYEPRESKVRVVTSRREKIAVKRLKIFGIKTPIVRKQ